MAISVQDLLEAGVHFGHQTKRWNPKMKPYIFGSRNGIHIFDLGKSMYCLNEACKFLYREVAKGGEVLMVGTKRQGQELVEEAATRDKMHYISHRWLGGTLTNLETIRKSISKLGKLQKMEEDGTFDKMKKKESSRQRREMNKLDRQLCGIIHMKKLPSVMVVLDIVKEHIAVKEAQILGIPVVALIDSNCDPDLVEYGVPGNDDAVRSLKIIMEQFSAAIHAGKGIADQKAAEKAKEDAEKKAARQKEKVEKAKAAAEKAKAAKEASAKKDEPKAEKAPAKKAPAKKAPAKKAPAKKEEATEAKAEKAPAKKAPAKKAPAKKEEATEAKAEKAPAKKAPAKKAPAKKAPAKKEEPKAE